MAKNAKAVRSSGIVLTGHVASQGIRLASNLIVARLLAPDLFGVMAIAFSLQSLVVMISDFGLTMCVVQSKNGDKKDFLRTIFSLKVLQGCLLTVIILIFSALLHLFNVDFLIESESALSHPDLPLALGCIAISSFVGSFSSVALELAQRNDSFGRVVSIELAAQVISTVFLISFAYYKPSIMALAFTAIVFKLSFTALSYLLFDNAFYRFGWSKSAVAEVLHFGKWIVGSSIVSGITKHGDKIFLGFLITAENLGLFAIASLFWTAMDGIFMKLNKALFPSISHVVRDKEVNKDKIIRVYYKVRLYRDALIAFPAAFLILNGEMLISILYDSRYYEAGWILQVLSLSFLILCFQYKGQVLLAMGQSKVQFQMATLGLAWFILVLPAAYYFLGFYGIIFAIALRTISGIWVPFYYFRQQGLLRFGYEARTLITIACAFIVSYGLQIPLMYISELINQS